MGVSQSLGCHSGFVISVCRASSRKNYPSVGIIALPHGRISGMRKLPWLTIHTNSRRMFRKEYAHSDHKCADCLQYVMLAASPLYLRAHLNSDGEKGEGTPLVEGLFDDLLAARFGIVVVS